MNHIASSQQLKALLFFFALPVTAIGCDSSDGRHDAFLHDDVLDDLSSLMDSFPFDTVSQDLDQESPDNSLDDVDTSLDVGALQSLRVLPENLLFPSVVVGCSSPPLQSCVVNIGMNEVEWRGFPAPIDSSFRVKNPESLPLMLAYGQVSCSEFVFSPKGVNVVECDVPIGYVEFHASTASISLSGRGLPIPTQSNDFLQVSGDTQFWLSDFPRPNSIGVYIDGTACLPEGNWRYDLTTNAVIFNLDGTCFPAPNSHVLIEYNPICTD